MLTVYGVTVLTFMMVMYAFERRDRRFILAFALGCALSSSYGFASRPWPFDKRRIYPGFGRDRPHRGALVAPASELTTRDLSDRLPRRTTTPRTTTSTPASASAHQRRGPTIEPKANTEVSIVHKAIQQALRHLPRAGGPNRHGSGSKLTSALHRFAGLSPLNRRCAR